MSETIAATEDKHDPDLEWRENLPPEFRSIAKRTGRELFAIAYNIGAITEALMILNRRVGGNNELMRAVTVLQNSANQITALLLDSKEITVPQIKEIQRDIEIASQLAGAQRNTPGGQIILPH